MLFCHLKVAMFACKKIRFMNIYFPRNFNPMAKRVKMEAAECRETYIIVCLTLKRQTKIPADDILFFFYFYLSKKIRLDFFM